ncbi:MAG: polymer-forming cytoskeletal protein [Deltaproteobacteria bacterium]|nr:polymer-forming cytoskeletal protein [Deltaproteobacteria bacterium]
MTRRSLLPLAALAWAALLVPATASAELGVLAVGSDRISYGQSVTVAAGDEVHDAVSFGGSVVIEEGATVTGDAVAMGGSVRVEEGATVQGDVTALGGSVSIGAGVTVTGDVAALGGSVDVDPSAEVLGSRVGSSRRSHHHHGDGGPPAKMIIIPDSEESRGLAGFFSDIVSTTAQYLTVLVLAFLLIVAMPKRIDRMRRPLQGDLAKSILAGLLLFIAFLPVTLLLVMTVVGIFLVPVLLLAYLATAVLGWTVVSLRVGRRLSPPGKRTPARELVLGMLVFFGFGLLAEIPVIGFAAGLVLLLATLAGTGAVVLSRFGERRVDPAAELWPPPDDLSAAPPA